MLANDKMKNIKRTVRRFGRVLGYDRIWGIGLKQEDKRAADPIQWQGSNLLGFALMDVREQLNGGL